MNVWYSVRDLDAARAFYADRLRFEETYYDAEDRWARLVRGGAEIGLTEGGSSGGQAIAAIEVEDLKKEADRLRAAGVEVGVVLEIPGAIRLLDVYDPDGNRLQFSQDIEKG